MSVYSSENIEGHVVNNLKDAEKLLHNAKCIEDWDVRAIVNQTKNIQGSLVSLRTHVEKSSDMTNSLQSLEYILIQLVKEIGTCLKDVSDVLQLCRGMRMSNATVRKLIARRNELREEAKKVYDGPEDSFDDWFDKVYLSQNDSK